MKNRKLKVEIRRGRGESRNGEGFARRTAERGRFGFGLKAWDGLTRRHGGHGGGKVLDGHGRDAAGSGRLGGDRVGRDVAMAPA